MTYQTWTIVAFVAYFAIIIGMSWHFRKAKGLSDFFLGQRSLGPWVGALSAQASDMSGWLLMGLPGVIIAFGMGNVWIAVGLIIGTFLNWVFIAKKLRRYTIKAGDAITVPQYLENRFHDKTRILKIVSALFFTFFFTVYTASFFFSVAVLLTIIFPGLTVSQGALIGAGFIVIYTFIGGFLAVSWTDLVMGSLMFFAIALMPLIALIFLGGWGTVTYYVPTNHFNMFTDVNGSPISITAVASGLAWGLGYFGMPHILVRFMAVKKESDIKPAAIIGVVWVVFALVASVLLGLIGMAFMGHIGLDLTGRQETIFIEMAREIFMVPGAVVAVPLIGAIFLTGMFAAIKSTADSQLLVTASALTGDIYTQFNKKASERHLVWASRFAIILVSIVAFVLAIDPNAGVMVLVAIAWAGLGSAFGPLIILTLYWKRINFYGALTGIVVGGITVITWVYIPFGGQTLATSTGLFALLPGFFLSLISTVIVTLLTPPPSNEIQAEFEDAQIALPKGQ